MVLQSLWGRVVLGKGVNLVCVWVEGSGPDLESGASEYLSHRARKVQHTQLPALLRYTPQLVLSRIAITQVGVWGRGQKVGGVSVQLLNFPGVVATLKWEHCLKQNFLLPQMASEERSL